MPRRERASILAALLLALDQTPVDARGITRIASKANLPHDRATSYLQELTEAGLVTPGHDLTVEGRAALQRYRDWAEVMERFGLD